LIAREEDVGLATLVGTKAWPYCPNSFVAIACFAKTKAEFDSDSEVSKEPTCTKYYDPNQNNGEQSVVVKLSASWQDKPLAERSRSQQKRFDSAQRTA